MLPQLRTWLVTNVAAVAALSGQKVHVNNADQGSPIDHINLEGLSENPNNHLGGVGGLKFAEIDIDCNASTPDAADTLAAAIVATLEPYKGAMGTISCKAVILNDTQQWAQPAKPGRDVGQYVTTLDITLQYA